MNDSPVPEPVIQPREEAIDPLLSEIPTRTTQVFELMPVMSAVPELLPTQSAVPKLMPTQSAVPFIPTSLQVPKYRLILQDIENDARFVAKKIPVLLQQQVRWPLWSILLLLACAWIAVASIFARFTDTPNVVVASSYTIPTATASPISDTAPATISVAPIQNVASPTDVPPTAVPPTVASQQGSNSVSTPKPHSASTIAAIPTTIPQPTSGQIG